jgi:hypothetical protein
MRRPTNKRRRSAVRSARKTAIADPSPKILLNQHLEILAPAGAMGAEKTLKKVVPGPEQI